MITDLTVQHENIIIVGDLNVNLLDTSAKYYIELNTIFDILSLRQIIKDPTRISKTSESLLDIIAISPNLPILESGTLEYVDISDHLPVYCYLDIHSPPIITENSFYRDLRNINTNELSKDAEQVNWDYVKTLTSLEDKLNYINSTIIDLYDVHAPLKLRRPKQRRQKPFITSVIKIMLKEKKRLYKKFKKYKTEDTRRDYVTIRDLTQKAIKAEKEAYFRFNVNRFERDSKQLWHFLEQNNIHKKKQNIINQDIDDPNVVNQYFYDSILQINPSKEYINKYLSTSSKKHSENFNFRPISSEKVEEYINGFNSYAFGVDGINALMLKFIATYCSSAIAHIINHSFVSHSIPNIWKISLITPLPKTQRAQELSDLRPVSVLCCLSKIQEKWIFEQLVEYVELNAILPKLQSGFRKSHSTTTALCKVTNDLAQALNDKKITFLVLLDYSKAFDTVPHELLLAKLSHYGCSPSVITWFSEYFSKRSQIVKLRNRCSEPLPIESGVLQGSILGPLLFAIFTADIVECITYPVQFHLYADDTQLYISCPHDQVRHYTELLNTTLKKIHDWSEKNALQLNQSKTKALCVGNKRIKEKYLQNQNINLCIGNTPVNIVSSVKSLGIIIDEDLSFGEHVNSKLRLGYSKLKMLYPSKNLLTEHTRNSLTNSVVLCHIDYALVTYYGFLTETIKNRIQIIQNSCFRFSFNVQRREHITPYYTDRGILRYNGRFTKFFLMFMYKLIEQKAPGYLLEQINFCETENIALRRNHAQIPKHNIEKFKGSFIYQFSKFYNSYYDLFTRKPMYCKEAFKINVLRKICTT